MQCKNIDKNKTLPKNELSPNKENTPTNKCGTIVNFTKIISIIWHNKATIDVIVHNFFLNRIF
jgi:hypothetical protein